MTLDTDGAAIVVGDDVVAGGDDQQVAVKYGVGGDLVWERRWLPAGVERGRALDVAVSPRGRVGLVGYGFDPTTRQNATVAVFQQGSLTSSPIPNDEGIELRCAPSVFGANTRVRFALPQTAAAPAAPPIALPRDPRSRRSPCRIR